MGPTTTTHCLWCSTAERACSCASDSARPPACRGLAALLMAGSFAQHSQPAGRGAAGCRRAASLHRCVHPPAASAAGALLLPPGDRQTQHSLDCWPPPLCRSRCLDAGGTWMASATTTSCPATQQSTRGTATPRCAPGGRQAGARSSQAGAGCTLPGRAWPGGWAAGLLFACRWLSRRLPTAKPLACLLLFLCSACRSSMPWCPRPGS